MQCLCKRHRSHPSQNVVLLGTFSISLGTASDRYETVLESLVDGTVLDERTLSATSIYLNRLNIVPSFMEEYYVLQWGFNQTLNPVNETGIDPLALSLQYYGQIVTALAAVSTQASKSESKLTEITEIRRVDPKRPSGRTRQPRGFRAVFGNGRQ
jgi:hypothetical protein